VTCTSPLGDKFRAADTSTARPCPKNYQSAAAILVPPLQAAAPDAYGRGFNAYCFWLLFNLLFLACASHLDTPEIYRDVMTVFGTNLSINAKFSGKNFAAYRGQQCTAYGSISKPACVRGIRSESKSFE